MFWRILFTSMKSALFNIFMKHFAHEISRSSDNPTILFINPTSPKEDLVAVIKKDPVLN
ncbi:hypothetical protein ISS30_01745 [bacterium]|nr:hypothetical protein [bacterium]